MIEKLVPYYGLLKYIGIILFCTSLVYFIYNKGYSAAEQDNLNKYNASLIKQQQEQMREFVVLSNKYYSISTEYQDFLKTNKDTVKVIHDTRIKEIEKPIYTECVIPISGLQNLNESIGRLNKDREAKNSK